LSLMYWSFSLLVIGVFVEEGEYNSEAAESVSLTAQTM